MTTNPTPPAVSPQLAARAAEARKRLDDHVRQTVVWHFDPKSGCPFWLEFADKLGWDPRREIQRYEDLDKFPRWLSRYKQVVVSRERNGNAKQPGPIVLRGNLPSA